MQKNITLEILKFVFKGIVSLILSLTLIFPLLLIVFGTNEIFRIVSRFVLLSKHGRKIYLVEKGLDAMYAFSQKTIIRVVAEMKKGEFDKTKFEEIVRGKCIEAKNIKGKELFTKLKRRYVEGAGYACWEEFPDIDLKQHFRTLTREDEVVDEERLMEIIEELEEPFDSAKPLWEFCYIPTMTNGKTGVIFRQHHAYGDGFSSVMLFSQTLWSEEGNNNEEDKEFPYVVNPFKRIVPVGVEILYNIGGIIMFSWTLFQEIFNSSTRVYPIRYPTIKEEKTHFARINLDLSQIKSIKKKSNISISTIISSAISGSLEKVLSELTLPSKIHTGNMCALFPYKKGHMANKTAFFNSWVPMRKDEMKRGEVIEKQTLNNYSMFMHSKLCRLFGRLPLFIMKGMNGRLPTFLLTSNIPWAKKQVTIMGSKIDTCGFAQRPISTGIFAVSCSNGNVLSLTTAVAADFLTKNELDLLLKEIPIQLNLMNKDQNDLKFISIIEGMTNNKSIV